MNTISKLKTYGGEVWKNTKSIATLFVGLQLCILGFKYFSNSKSENFSVKQNIKAMHLQKKLAKKGDKWLGELDEYLMDYFGAEQTALLSHLSSVANTPYGLRYNFNDIKGRRDYVDAHPLTSKEDHAPEQAYNGVFPVPGEWSQLRASRSGQLFPATLAQQTTLTDFWISTISTVLGRFHSGYYGNLCPELHLSPGLYDNVSAGDGHSYPGLPLLATDLSLISVTPNIANLPEALRLYVHMIFALRERNLKSIHADSIYDVIAAFDVLKQNWQQLVLHIERGNVDDLLDLDENIKADINKHLKPDKKLATQLRQIFQKGFSATTINEIWRDLTAIIAPYSDATILRYLRDQYSGTRLPVISPTYATPEGFIGANVDLLDDAQYIFLSSEAFCEYIPELNIYEETPRTEFADKLEKGKSYEIVLTNYCNLYRYRTGDVIQITDFNGKTPVFRFHYRMSQTLNLAGELLTENALMTALYTLLDAHAEARYREMLAEAMANLQAGEDHVRVIRPRLGLRDYCVVESRDIPTETRVSGQWRSTRRQQHYVLFLEGDEHINPQRLAEQVDEQLHATHPGYQAARTRGALAPLCVTWVRPGTFTAVRQQLCRSGGPATLRPSVDRVVRDPHVISLLISACNSE